MQIAAKIGTMAANAGGTDWKDVFRTYLSDSFQIGTDIHIPCEHDAKFASFRLKGLSGCNVYFDDLINLYTNPGTHNNLGLYQNLSASLHFPDAVGVIGQQLFNSLLGYNGRVDIYLPGTSGMLNSRYTLISGCNDTHLHFGVDCEVVKTWLTGEINLSTQLDRFTVHGTDGTLTWDGSEWAFTPSAANGGGITANA